MKQNWYERQIGYVKLRYILYWDDNDSELINITSLFITSNIKLDVTMKKEKLGLLMFNKYACL